MSERNDWFVTSSGRRFELLDPCPESICIEDIAHALGHVCRFGGHVQRFYSVAQHSVLVSWLVAPELALHGLMHDAAEAYCQDIVRPLKLRLGEAYETIEERIAQAIAVRFELRPLADAERAEIKRADRIALVTERRDLVAPHSWEWTEDELGVEPCPERIAPLGPRSARTLFLARYRALEAQR